MTTETVRGRAHIFTNIHDVYNMYSTLKNSDQNYVNRKYYLILNLLYKFDNEKYFVLRKVILYSAQVDRNEQISIVFSSLRVHPAKNNLQTLYINILFSKYSARVPAYTLRNTIKVFFFRFMVLHKLV